MSVASHLGIELAQYDRRIRTFIPDYEEMLNVAAESLPDRTKFIVDLGIGTGALSMRCLSRLPAATVLGIDLDPEILRMAQDRLGGRARTMQSSFLRAGIPPCDAVVNSFALHHIRTRAAKASFYKRLRKALRRGGVLVCVDCNPASERDVAQRQFAAWKDHLMRSYSEKEAAGYLEAWSHEDVYVPLAAEVDLQKNAGFRPEVVWRKGAFAVLLAR
jgi:trans-aconitate methyltransferase